MTFALCPDGGPPRIWRFVQGGSLGYSGGRAIVAMLLPGNILKIDQALYDQLIPHEQHMLLRTHAAFSLV